MNKVEASPLQRQGNKKETSSEKVLSQESQSGSPSSIHVWDPLRFLSVYHAHTRMHTQALTYMNI